MFNVGGPEILVILLLALIVLGPQRLPDAARQLGRFRAEIRKLSSGFQEELRTAFDEETETAGRVNGAAVAPAEPPSDPVPGPGAEPVADPAPAPPAAKRRRRTEPLRANRSSGDPSAP